MVHQQLALFSVLALAAAGAQQYVAFDGASASSMYSAGNLVGSPAYAAQQGLSSGSGYWYCSICVLNWTASYFQECSLLQVLQRQPCSRAESAT